jgi:hypothetical protein
LFYRGFGRFVTRGVQKRENFVFQTNLSGLITKNVFFFPSVLCFLARFFARFFYRIFGRFVTRRVQKRDLKKSKKYFRSRQKKYLLTSLFWGAHGPPWAVFLVAPGGLLHCFFNSIAITFLILVWHFCFCAFLNKCCLKTPQKTFWGKSMSKTFCQKS